MRKYITLKDMDKEDAIAFGRLHKLKIVYGVQESKDVYFAGTWPEPMFATVYKPSQEGKELAKKLPKYEIRPEPKKLQCNAMKKTLPRPGQWP